jgi:SAM-dependent methyltransferase
MKAHHDDKTHNYFDNFTPSYNPERFQFAVDFINQNADPSATLLDIGCGDGATLAMIKNETPLRNLIGLDIAPNYLAKARQSVGCETVEGSILDEDLVAKHESKYDFCSLGAVIHHLIGDTRQESTELGRRSVINAIRMLKKGGHLLVFEPTYSPRWAAALAFGLKKTCTKLTSNRVEMFKSWANFGEPVVSYYTPDMLRGFINDAANSEIALWEELDNYKFALGLLHRRGMAVIVRKTA